MNLEGLNETEIARKLGVSQSQISIDLAIIARRNVKWYQENSRIKDRLERYLKESRDRFNHVLKQCYQLYYSAEDKPNLRLGALNLAKSISSELASMGGIPDLQMQGFVDDIETMRKEWNELKQKAKVKPITEEVSS